MCLKDFFSKTKIGRSIGEKIRSIRGRKQISVLDVSDTCHLSKAAILHYENDIREPKADKLQEIASALGVDVSALYDRKIESISDIMHILFEVEAGGYIAPSITSANPPGTQDAHSIRIMNQVLNEAVEKWSEKRELWETGQISDDDYRNWQDAFPQEYEVEVHPERKTVPEKSAISDYRTHSLDFLKKLQIVMMYDTEQVESALEKDHAKHTADAFHILKMNLFNWLKDEIDKMEQEPSIVQSDLSQTILNDSDKTKK